MCSFAICAVSSPFQKNSILLALPNDCTIEQSPLSRIGRSGDLTQNQPIHSHQITDTFLSLIQTSN